MSGITWQTFQATDFGSLESVGGAWQQQTTVAATEYESSIFEDNTVLSEGSGEFEGDGADEARAYFKRALTALMDDLEYARKIKNLLLDAAEWFTAKQSELEELLSSAPKELSYGGGIGEEQFWISTGGPYAPSPFTPAGPLFEPGRGLGDDLILQDQADAYTEQFKALMQEVRDYDDGLRADFEAIGDGAQPLPPKVSGEDFSERTAEYLFEQLGEDAGDPEKVNDWWNGLDEEEREHFLEDSPELIAQLDGIPSEDRNTANRDLLEQELASFEGLDDEIEALEQTLAEARTLDGAGEHTWSELGAMQDELQGLYEERDRRDDLIGLTEQLDMSTTTGQEILLLGYDGAGDGQAIMSIGNPDTAAHTGVYVPGTESDLAGIGGLMERTDTMSFESSQADLANETAMVMWLGYDAPDDPVQDSPSLSYAKDGADDLASFMGGLGATNDDPAETTTTVLGHSYGSTVVGEAASEYGLDTDQIVSVASPGMNVDNVHQLGIDAEDYYSTTAPLDVINTVAPVDIPLFNGDHLGLGRDPDSMAFGGNHFDSDSMSFDPVDVHGNYWDEGNPARQNMGLIFTGQGAATT